MGALWAILTSRLAGPIAAVVALALAISLIVADVQRRSAVDRGDKLYAEIHNDVNGYKARLARCTWNGAALSSSLQSQNAKFDVLSKDSAARLEAAEAALARARTVTDKANGQIAILMSRPPAGIDTCARVLDIDARVKEMFEQ